MTHSLTPDEAKTKICPMAKGGSSMGKDSLCVAQGCMAWRWRKGESSWVELVDPDHPVKWELRESLEIVSDPTHGYCGMVGGDR